MKKFFKSKLLQNQQPSITGKDKVNFSLPSPQPINSSVVWCHPHFYAIFNLNFCLLVFEAARARLLNLYCSYKLHETFKSAFLVSSQNRLQNGDLPAIWPGMEVRSQPLGRGGPEESKRWERAWGTPAAPSHILANCAVGGLYVRSRPLGDKLHICLLNKRPGHGK